MLSQWSSGRDPHHTTEPQRQDHQDMFQSFPISQMQTSISSRCSRVQGGENGGRGDIWQHSPTSSQGGLVFFSPSFPFPSLNQLIPLLSWRIFASALRSQFFGLCALNEKQWCQLQFRPGSVSFFCACVFLLKDWLCLISDGQVVAECQRLDRHHHHHHHHSQCRGPFIRAASRFFLVLFWIRYLCFIIDSQHTNHTHTPEHLLPLSR